MLGEREIKDGGHERYRCKRGLNEVGLLANTAGEGGNNNTERWMKVKGQGIPPRVGRDSKEEDGGEKKG